MWFHWLQTQSATSFFEPLLLHETIIRNNGSKSTITISNYLLDNLSDQLDTIEDYMACQHTCNQNQQAPVAAAAIVNTMPVQPQQPANQPMFLQQQQPFPQQAQMSHQQQPPQQQPQQLMLGQGSFQANQAQMGAYGGPSTAVAQQQSASPPGLNEF